MLDVLFTDDDRIGSIVGDVDVTFTCLSESNTDDGVSGPGRWVGARVGGSLADILSTM